MFVGKLLELEIIMNKTETRKTNITCFLSYVESRERKDIEVEGRVLGKNGIGEGQREGNIG
jgi:hypothetical protein